MIQMSKPEPKRNKLYPVKLFLFLGARNYSLRKTVPGLSSGCHNETITKYRSLGGVYFLAIPKAGSPGSGRPSGLVGACPCLCAHSGVSVLKDANPTVSGPNLRTSFNLNSLSSPNTATSGVGASTCKLRWGTIQARARPSDI